MTARSTTNSWVPLVARILVALLAASGAVLLLGVAVDSGLRADGSTRIDHTIAVWVVERRTGAATTLWKTVTWLGSSDVIVPLTVLVVVLHSRLRSRAHLVGPARVRAP